MAAAFEQEKKKLKKREERLKKLVAEEEAEEHDQDEDEGHGGRMVRSCWFVMNACVILLHSLSESRFMTHVSLLRERRRAFGSSRGRLKRRRTSSVRSFAFPNGSPCALYGPHTR